MSAAPEVSIVIAAYNAAGTLREVLDACRLQDLPRRWETIVVDDGSTDGTRALAERAGARVLSQANRGPAAARNFGWRSAAAPIILFTDSDCVPRTDWARLLSAGIDATHAAHAEAMASPIRALARGIDSGGNPLATFAPSKVGGIRRLVQFGGDPRGAGIGRGIR